jgi:hypothetical protein
VSTDPFLRYGLLQGHWLKQEWTRAVTIRPARRRFGRGWSRWATGGGGFYAPEWIDRYFWRIGGHNANQLLPECQQVTVGDIIADAPAMPAYWQVKRVEPEGPGLLVAPPPLGAASRSTPPTPRHWPTVRRRCWPAAPTCTSAGHLCCASRLLGGPGCCSAPARPTRPAGGHAPAGLVDAYLGMHVLHQIKRRVERHPSPVPGTAAAGALLGRGPLAGDARQGGTHPLPRHGVPAGPRLCQVQTAGISSAPRCTTSLPLRPRCSSGRPRRPSVGRR